MPASAVLPQYTSANTLNSLAAQTAECGLVLLAGEASSSAAQRTERTKSCGCRYSARRAGLSRERFVRQRATSGELIPS